MNNTAIVAIVAILAIGGGAYFFMNNGDSTGQDGNGENQQENVAQSGTFADIFASGESVECTFAHDDGTNVSSGVVYMAENGNRIRGDFTIEEGPDTNNPMEAHMVRVDNTNYVWGSFYEQGVKMEVTAEERDQLFPEDDSTTVDPNTEYDCKSWSVDESKFDLPSNIDFIDMQTHMQQNIEMSGDMKAQQCAACEQLQDPSAQAQCKQALQCN